MRWTHWTGGSAYGAGMYWLGRGVGYRADLALTHVEHHGSQRLTLVVFKRQFCAHERAKRLNGEVNVLRRHVANQESQAVTTKITQHA